MRRPKKPGMVLPLFAILLLVTWWSCVRESKQASSPGNVGMMDDSLLKYNKEVASYEDLQIDDFVARYRWDVKKSPTGLRYMIYKRGTGPRASVRKTAVIRYELRLLNGDLCYSSDISGVKEFLIGHSNVERGLDEGILLMNVGDRAKFIVPSHLGFGLLGDQKKIPQRATLVYDIELVELK